VGWEKTEMGEGRGKGRVGRGKGKGSFVLPLKIQKRGVNSNRG